jgi:LDH2 family malate/lactate/ureidoglycolate dehydrogenase
MGIKRHRPETIGMMVTEEWVRRHCVALLERLGVGRDDAAVTADVFIQAELMGEESHGLRLFLHVLGRLETGGDRAATRITKVMDRGTDIGRTRP